MSDFTRMVYNYTTKESNRIKKICDPIERYFGVNHFWYSRTTAEGRYFSLASNPEMHEYYHESKFHRFSPFFRDPALITPGIYYYPHVKDQNFQKTLDQAASKMQVFLGVGLVFRQGQELIRFGYAIDPKVGFNLVDMVFNNLSLLQKFNDYFLVEAKDILMKAEDDFVDLRVEMGELYKMPPQGLKATLTLEDRRSFLRTIGCTKQFEPTLLSAREKTCLKYLLEGYTARATAEELGISNRTVEGHLEACKNKLNCFSKQELFQEARLLESCGFFEG